MLFFGPHVCDEECDTERGCYIAKAETGRFERISKAKRICESCEIVTECRDWAVATAQPFGVWGATTERDRRAIIKERQTHG